MGPSITKTVQKNPLLVFFLAQGPSRCLPWRSCPTALLLSKQETRVQGLDTWHWACSTLTWGLQHFYSTYQLLSKGKSNKSLERISFTGLWWLCQAEKSEDVLCSVTCPPKTFSTKTSASPQKSNTASVSLHSSLLGIRVQ